ncbi:4Fe-4S dicluster domain-containing protein [Desulfopila aestuarii]|uniref:2-oxoglutarate ferredoxin oxidoreductase subunit delta n=1 Tax=Desulfopila aestuarii DSM 18488 TaxID=1121416 RepID=A0A1M7Y551_9BACT|nr:4Fe-4S binding protein [Desulfopila aestuarii]SHO47550.1 2-oxoglutarate ferredoxin oxidoreductase subunit delta [Desulfopila aestuarii DSM 18488]
MAGIQGIPHIAVDRCKGCGLCVSVCPQSVLAISDGAVNVKGYQPAIVAEPERCIGCTSCALICPDVVISVERIPVKKEVKS